MVRNFLRGLKNEKENMKKKDRKKFRWTGPSKKVKDKDEEDKEK
ncbi:MAG: hypothetical protein Q7S06_01020 [Nanoarchaeota archaeon]|nr:hypothetical protein [Nanoarchaeota archaeon]